MNTILKCASLEMATREGLVLSKRSQRSVDFTWFVGPGFRGLCYVSGTKKGCAREENFKDSIRVTLSTRSEGKRLPKRTVQYSCQ